jgi:hypothetical protein
MNGPELRKLPEVQRSLPYGQRISLFQRLISQNLCGYQPTVTRNPVEGVSNHYLKGKGAVLLAPLVLCDGCQDHRYLSATHKMISKTRVVHGNCVRNHVRNENSAGFSKMSPI